MVDRVARAGGNVVITPHDVTYSAVEGSRFHSSGAVTLNVVVIFDKLNNDVEILNNLELHIVDTLPKQIDCSIANVDITRNSMLVRIPKIPNVEQEQQMDWKINGLETEPTLLWV
jgi:hypothetical protein